MSHSCFLDLLSRFLCAAAVESANIPEPIWEHIYIYTRYLLIFFRRFGAPENQNNAANAARQADMLWLDWS